MAVWIPLSKAVKRFGPVVGPVLVDKVRREAQPYWQAYQQAKRIDGHLGAWQDRDGKHWVVIGPSRDAVAGSFPPMSRAQEQLALEHLDTSALVHHGDTVFAKLEQAPQKLKQGRLRDVLPTRRTDG